MCGEDRVAVAVPVSAAADLIVVSGCLMFMRSACFKECAVAGGYGKGGRMEEGAALVGPVVVPGPVFLEEGEGEENEMSVVEDPGVAWGPWWMEREIKRVVKTEKWKGKVRR